jgi:DNA repair exonuclease SbcCD nuclease subunit
VKFLHCADVHIDSPLRGLSSGEGVPVEEVRGATRAAFDNLVTLAVDEGVTAVVIAGDLYDGDRDDYDTAIYLNRQFSRLGEHGIPVVLAYGNHDAASEITRRLRPPENVRVFSHARPETFVLEDAGLALHGQSYRSRAVTQDLSSAYPDRVPGYVNLGVLHTCLDGRPGHEPYAPCRLDALYARGYEYWALGHVHTRDELRRDGAWIVFPGNIQGRHARENGAKGASLVEYSGEQIVGVEHRDLYTVRWTRVPVDVSEAGTLDDVLASVGDAVATATADEGARLTAVRVELRGHTRVATELVRTRESWEAQLRADLAGASARVWLEKVESHVSLPQDSEHMPDQGEAIKSIQEAVASLREDEEERARLTFEFSALRAKLGGDLSHLVDLGCADLTETGIGVLLEEAQDLLVAELQGRE